jgi:hypothetical protein
MAKNITTDLLTSIRENVAKNATLLTIRRDDGTTYFLTNHDTPLVVDGLTYTNRVPFTISAIQTASQLSVDTCEVEIGVGGDIITQGDLDANLFRSGEIEISDVDWAHPEYGVLILRKGWFSRIESRRDGVAVFEVGGLLKLLDFSVGRVYQASCDADLGSRRCRVAINQSQAYSPLNRYVTGDWVHVQDKSAMTALSSLVNGGFEADGARNVSQAITGWERSPDSWWVVASNFTNFSGSFPAQEGTYFLTGGEITADFRREQFVRQTVDLIAGGMDAADIDAGVLMFALFVRVVQSIYFEDPPRIMLEYIDAQDRVIRTHDTGYFVLDRIEEWREKALIYPVVANARSARITLYGALRDGIIVNVGYDNVEAYFWDQTLVRPNNDTIYRVSRIVSQTSPQHIYGLANPSFDSQSSNVPNNDVNVGSGAITGWTKGIGSFWGTDTTFYGVTGSVDGARVLLAGDDLSGIQQTYTIAQLTITGDVETFDADRILVGRAALRLRGSVFELDETHASAIEVEFRSAANSLLDTWDALPLGYHGPTTGPALTSFDVAVMIPSGTARIVTRLVARTPAASSTGGVGFDNLSRFIYDVDAAVQTDPVSGQATGAGFSFVDGAYDIDGSLIWKATPSFTEYDQVATVTDAKNFTSTTMAGSLGAFETSAIYWISGNNAGSTNVIRRWDPDTKGIRLYFPSPRPIQVGDRFQYNRACQKRFLEDCVAVFSNGINFQGFPYLPGRLDTPTEVVEEPPTP